MQTMKEKTNNLIIGILTNETKKPEIRPADQFLQIKCLIQSMCIKSGYLAPLGLP